MKQLEQFIRILTGRFDNSAQVSAGGGLPFAEHVNTVCNDKISGLPDGFQGIFVLEESYYTTDGKTHASPHLFLFTEEEAGVRLTSYQIPKGYEIANFTDPSSPPVPYSVLQVSEKFTPALYMRKGEVWEGGSVSMFTPALKFTLWERFSSEELEVTERMEAGGKRTFGYDEPIRYRRK